MVSKLYVCQKDINNKYIERLTLFEGIFERRDVRAEPWMGEVGSRTGLRWFRLSLLFRWKRFSPPSSFFGGTFSSQLIIKAFSLCKIGEGGIDNLITSYKEFLPRMGGYMTDGSGRVNLRRAELMLQELGRIEDDTFHQRKKTHDIISQRREQRRKRDQDKREAFLKEQRAKRKTRDFDLSNSNYVIFAC